MQISTQRSSILSSSSIIVSWNPLLWENASKWSTGLIGLYYSQNHFYEYFMCFPKCLLTEGNSSIRIFVIGDRPQNCRCQRPSDKTRSSFSQPRGNYWISPTSYWFGSFGFEFVKDLLYKGHCTSFNPNSRC